MFPGNPVPILRSFDENKATEFYVDFLGFTIDWKHRFEATLPLLSACNPLPIAWRSRSDTGVFGSASNFNASS